MGPVGVTCIVVVLLLADIAVVALAKAPHANVSGAAAYSAGTRYITKCSYDTVIKGAFTWPGVDDVCSYSSRNSCIEVPTLAIGMCFTSRSLGSGYSYQVLTNETNFWTQIYKDTSRDEHCQEGTEVKVLTDRMKKFPRGPFNSCIPYYPGDGKLNRDWESPSNFCSTHGHKVSDTKDAHSCVSSAQHTSGGDRCPNADYSKSSITSICGGSVWDAEPPCGCFQGYMYFA